MSRGWKRNVVVVLPLAALAAWAAASCSNEHPKGDSRWGQSSSALSVPAGVPYLDFDQNASDPNAIALTFDDGPDDTNTKSVLDTLRAKGVHATFFINTVNYTDVRSDSTAQALVQRMSSDGHDVGNHTVHHDDLSLSSTDVTSELQGVDDLLHQIAPSFLQHRFARAPYGNPYFGPQSSLDSVAPIVAKYGVHVGWNIDSLDWQCQDDGKSSQCVRDNVLSAVDAGKSGIVLMHCVNPLTASILPTLIDDLRGRGKYFVSVESLVQQKYGDLSRHLFYCDSNSDCVSGELCVSQHCAVSTTSADAGTDTGATDTATSDTGTADSGTSDTSSGGGGGTSTLACASFTVSSGSIGGSSSACSGSPAALAANDGTYLEYSPSSTSTKADGYATYVSPYAAAQVTGLTVDVAFRGDDKTEPLWYWYARDAATGAWTRIGDDSWAANWATTTHTFTVASPASYVDASGRISIRFTTTSSTNNAELGEMIVHVTATSGTDAGTTSDAGTDDSTASDSTTAADSTTADAGGTTPVTDTLTCSALTKISGALYGSASTACGGTTPALAAVDGTFVGWSGESGSTKSSAYATYVTSAPASSVTALSLVVAFRGDDKTEQPWFWYAKNVSTGAWDLVGDNAWAGNWATTTHTFAIADPSAHVASNGAVEILFTTTASTNDAEMEQMILRVTH